MKFYFYLCIIILLTFSACTRTETYSDTYQIPIIERTTVAEAEAGFGQEAPHQLTTFGNIYVYQNYLLVNERGVGIHIYDNQIPENPTPITFINIPGNVDMAIRNDILFADSYDDLLSIDISNPQSISLIQRLDNVFPQNHPTIGRIVGWKDTTVYYEEDVPLFWWQRTGNGGLGSNDDNDVFVQSTVGSSTGTAGSMARFTIIGNHLYAVDRSNLYSIDIAATSMSISQQTPINFWTEVETIFPYGQHLFIGSTDGVFIYEAIGNGQVNFTSQFTHATACDPVYVSDSLAFVTLRSNNNNLCWGTLNQMDVLNVQDISQPWLIKSFAMSSPHGIGVKDSLIFVCEGTSGLKVFDYQRTLSGNNISDVSLNLKHWNQNIEATDVIPMNNHLIVVGDNSLNQYSVKSDGSLKHLSIIN